MAANRQTDRHTYIHTHVRNAVTLVWGSLRLAPIMVLIAYLQLLAKNPHIGAWLLSYHTGSLSNWHALLVAFEVEDEPGKLKVIHCQRHSAASK